MDFLNCLLLFFLLKFLSAAAQYTNCDYSFSLTSAGQKATIGLPTANNGAGSQCRYKVTSPWGTYMEATCFINIAGVKISFTIR